MTAVTTILIKILIFIIGSVWIYSLNKQKRKYQSRSNNYQRQLNHARNTLNSREELLKNCQHPIAIVNRGENYKFTLVSEGWLNIFNLRNNIQGKGLLTVFKNFPNNLKEDFLTVIKSKQKICHQYPMAFKYKDDLFWLQWSITPWINLENQEIIGLILEIKDLTSYVTLETEYKSTLNMGQVFLNTVAHQVKSKARYISLNIEKLNDLQIINNFNSTDNLLIEQYETITNQFAGYAKDLHKLCDQLVTLGNSSQIEFDDNPVDIRELIKQVTIEDASHSIIFAENSSSERPLYVQGSSSLLKEVFSELLINSRKYQCSDRPLKILITMGREGEREQNIKVSIKDNGIGVDPEKLELLFTPYFRIHEEIGGDGLGLSFVKQVLLKHNATISIDSIPNSFFEVNIIFWNVN